MKLRSLGLVAIVSACVGHIGGDPYVDTPGGSQRLRRLSIWEYVRTVEDLTAMSIPPHRFMDDTLETGYDNGPASLVIQPEQESTYEEIADEIASQTAMAHREKLVGGCASDCKDAYLDGFARRAYRRPLSPDERARLGTLWDQAGTDALRAVTTAILQSPHFLYREEIGDASGELGPFELASELSYFLVGTAPDDALLDAAASGTLDLEKQARRLLATPRGREQMRHFFDMWLGTANLPFATKDPFVYPQMTDDLRAAMRTELDHFYDRSTTLEELFTSNWTTGDVELDPKIYSGVLTRGGFLSVHASSDSSNPIERGVFVLSSILCAAPPPPPPNVVRLTKDPPPTAITTRQKVEQHATDAYCQSCHARIDGIGFGFEEFDGIGMHRTMENGVPVDASGSIFGEPFTGVVELEQKLIRQPEVPACFVRQMVRWALGTVETADDEAVIDEIAAHFDVKTRFSDLAVAVVESRAFAKRKVMP